MAGHAAHRGLIHEIRNYTHNSSRENLRTRHAKLQSVDRNEGDHWGDLNADSMILKLIYKKQNMAMLTN